MRAGARVITLLLMIAGLSLLSGCSSSIKSYRYYTLQPMAVPSGAGLQGSIGVNPVVIPEWLDQHSLVWSDGGFRLHKADLDRWGEPVPKAITRIMAENLNRLSDTWVTAGPWLRSQRPDQVIEIELLSLAKQGEQVILDARWSINKKERHPTIKQKQFYQPVTGKASAEQLVEAFSKLLADLAMEIKGQL